MNLVKLAESSVILIVICSMFCAGNITFGTQDKFSYGPPEFLQWTQAQKQFWVPYCSVIITEQPINYILIKNEYVVNGLIKVELFCLKLFNIYNDEGEGTWWLVMVECAVYWNGKTEILGENLPWNHFVQLESHVLHQEYNMGILCDSQVF